MTGGANSTTVGALVGGKYRIVRLLAQGGMGVVYEAHHALVRRRFAIKFLRRDLALAPRSSPGSSVRREAAGALENENVAAAVDFGISADGDAVHRDGVPRGRDLGALLERAGRLPIARAGDLVVQACRGVEAAHAAGIVHRDLKPAQPLPRARRDDGTDLVKVLDFGIAKLQAARRASTAATRTGAMLGTPAYMSPEQARGDGRRRARRRLRAGRDPLRAPVAAKGRTPGDSQNAILHHIATQPAVPLDAERGGLPATLVDIIAGGALRVRARAPPPAADGAGARRWRRSPRARSGRRRRWPRRRSASADNAARARAAPAGVARGAGAGFDRGGGRGAFARADDRRSGHSAGHVNVRRPVTAGCPRRHLRCPRPARAAAGAPVTGVRSARLPTRDHNPWDD